MPWSPVGTTPPMRPSPIRPIAVLIKGGSPSPLIHVAVRHCRRGRRFLLRDIRDERLGREQQRCDRRRVLQRHALDLRRVDDAGLHHVDVLHPPRTVSASRPHLPLPPLPHPPPSHTPPAPNTRTS